MLLNFENAVYGVCHKIHYWQWIARYSLAYLQYDTNKLDLSDILGIAGEAYLTDSENHPADTAYLDADGSAIADYFSGVGEDEENEEYLTLEIE